MKKILILLFIFACAEQDIPAVPVHLEHKRWSSAVSNLASTIHKCEEHLVQKHWKNEPELVDQLLPIVKKRFLCAREANKAVRGDFYSEFKNRRGYLSMVPAEDCTEVFEQIGRTEVTTENGKIVIRNKDGELIRVNECGGHPFPETADDLRPNDYYLEILRDAEIGTYNCLDIHLTELLRTFDQSSLGDKCSFQGHPNMEPYITGDVR